MTVGTLAAAIGGLVVAVTVGLVGLVAMVAGSASSSMIGSTIDLGAISPPEAIVVIDQAAAAASPCGLSPAVLLAQQYQESRFNPATVGPPTQYGTALGMSQFLPATFASYDMPVPPGGANPPTPFDPTDAAYAEARMLCADGAMTDLTSALIAYDCGGSPCTSGAGYAASIEAIIRRITSPAGLADPLRAISGLAPERIDQGVDYSGSGPIYAIGPGVVLTTTMGGWPGSAYISYRLTGGPMAGLTVYAAEDIHPAVTVGQTVTASTVLGQMYRGGSGIETGWANGGSGETMARAVHQFSGANSTAFGANFSALLASLGAPPGIAQNNPPTGSLPTGWAG